VGYYIEQRGTRFFVLAEDKPKIVKVLRSLPHRRYDWVDDNFHQLTDIHEMGQAWRWQFDTDNDGNINDIWFQGQKLGDEETFFKTIAPFVRDSSFIEMEGDDDERWRWVFKNGQLYEQDSKLVWGELRIA